VDAILIYEHMYDSPYLLSKIEKFKQTEFFKIKGNVYSKLLGLFFEHANKLKFSEEIYKKVVDCYLETIDYVIGNSLGSYFRFPFRKMLILSIFRKDVRAYIKSIIKRYKTLCLVSEFLSGSRRANPSEISCLFKEIYEEVIK
jgi:hypothetical protein